MSRWFSSFRVKPSVEACTGPHTVGCTDFMCGPQITQTGSANGNKQGPDHGTFVRLFYPALPSNCGEEIEQDKVAWMPLREYVDGMISYMKLPAWLLGGAFHWLIGSTKIPAYSNAPILSSKCFPCVVFSHGLGGNRYLYSTFCCELASKGCVVAAVEHRDQSASATYILQENQEPNKLSKEWISYHRLSKDDDEFQLRNTQVHQRATECINALDILEKLQQGDYPSSLLSDTLDLCQLKGRLDLDKVAIMGHSFGGATTVCALAKDNRFKCGICLDIWMLPVGNEVFEHENQQPVLFVNSQNFHKWKENMKPLKKLVDINKDKHVLIAIRGTGHMNQSDIPSILPERLLNLTGMGSVLDQETAVKLNRQAIWAFLQRHLDIGEAPEHAPILDGGEGTPEHIVIGPDWPPKNEALASSL